MSEATAELRAEGGAYVRAAATWVAQAADALAHAHGKGVLHRDIKPSNLLLDVKGRVRVVDFGLAQVEEAAPVTRTGAILGTLTYMAPEALLGQRGRADARADIYSLGAVLYEILAFQPPFLSDSLHALVQEVHTGEPPRLRAVHRGAPRDLIWITGKCLAKEPHHRYATAGDLADDLRRFLDGRSVRARPAGPVRRLRYWARRRPARALLLGLALAAGALAWPVARLVESAKVEREADAERRLAATKLDEHRAGRAALAKQRAEFSLRKGVGEIAPGESGGATRAHWERTCATSRQSRSGSPPTRASPAGGSWGGGDPRFYRASYEDWTGEGYFNHTCGFRPILLPRGSPR